MIKKRTKVSYYKIERYTYYEPKAAHWIVQIWVQSIKNMCLSLFLYGKIFCVLFFGKGIPISYKLLLQMW